MARVNGFPQSIGYKMLGAADISGPASYSQYTAPSTGGQDVQALPEFGVKQVDLAMGGVSVAGTHRAEVVQIEASTVNGVSLGATRLVLKWYVVATGAEAAGSANLSGQTVRVLVIGDK
jgi:hypothetical protein